MTSDQFAQLINMLDRLISKPYTLTGAADWPILAVLGAILVTIIGFMWRDLRSIISDNKVEAVRENGLIWKALHDCQNECCPRKKVP